jgi:hypothetical protein
MTDKQTQNAPAAGNMKKDPDNWVTGEEPMTGAQRSYLKTLSEEAGEPFDDNLTKADASRRIDELQATTGRRPPGQEPRSDGGQAPAGRQEQGGNQSQGRDQSQGDNQSQGGNQSQGSNPTQGSDASR